MTDRTQLPRDGSAAFRDDKHTLSDEKNLYGHANRTEAELIEASNRLSENLKKAREEKQSWDGRREPNHAPDPYVSLRDVRKDHSRSLKSRSNSRPSIREEVPAHNKENYERLNDRYINSSRGPSDSPEKKPATSAQSHQALSRPLSYSQEPQINSHSSIPIDHHKLRSRPLDSTARLPPPDPNSRQPPLAPLRSSVVSSGRFDKHCENKSPYKQFGPGSPLRIKTQENEYLQQVIDELIQKNDMLKTEIVESTVKQVNTQQKLDKAKTMINDLKSLKNDINTLKEKTTEAERSKVPEIEQLQEEKAALKKELQKMTELKEKFEHQATKLKALASAQQNELTQNVQTHSESARKIADMIAEMNQCKERERDSGKIIENLQSTNSRLKSDMQSLSEQLRDAKMQLPSVSRVESQRRLDDESRDVSPTAANSKPISYVPIRNRSTSNNRSKSPRPNAQQFPQAKIPEQIHAQEITDFEQQQLDSTKKRLFEQAAAMDLTPYNMESAQMQADDKLVQRCARLESYCKDLISTNKILDMENKLAIAQIVHLLDPKQLSNFTTALRQVEQAPKTIYEKGNTSGLPRHGRTTVRGTSRARSSSANRMSNVNMPRPSQGASTQKDARSTKAASRQSGPRFMTVPKNASTNMSQHASRQASNEKRKSGGQGKAQSNKQFRTYDRQRGNADSMQNISLNPQAHQQQSISGASNSVLQTEHIQSRNNQLQDDSNTQTPYGETDPNVIKEVYDYSEADEEIKEMLQEEEIQEQQQFFEESSGLDNAITELKNYLDQNNSTRTFELTKLDHFGYRLEMLNPVEGQEPVDVTLRLDQDTIMILLESGYADFIDFLTENGYLSV